MSEWTVAVKDPKSYELVIEVHTKAADKLAAIARVRAEFPEFAYNAKKAA